MTEAGRITTIALSSRDLDPDAKPLSAAEVWRLVDDSTGAEDLVESLDRGNGDPELQSRVLRRLKHIGAVDALLAGYRERGIWVLTPFDVDYPASLRMRLGDGAPPLLHGVGNPRLLACESIGIVGSRDLSEAAVDTARALACATAREGFAVVSGGARGADQIAMEAAAEMGGAVVGVLTQPLERQARAAQTLALIEEGRVCLVTPFKPSAGFSVANAMARNRIIYGLSACTVVVATALEEGGTWAGATEALRRRFGRVAVWSGAGSGAGNGPLATMGATPVSSLDELIELAREPWDPSPPQLSLDVR